MGMYTQVRGWLNIVSVGDYYQSQYIKAEERLEKAKREFQTDDTIMELYNNEPLERKWVCEDTYIHGGGNGSAYIFIGTELKNYGNPAEVWIKYLLKYFPNAEGRMDFQYEKDKDECKYWLIANGKIIKESVNPVWCKGYGNDFE